MPIACIIPWKEKHEDAVEPPRKDGAASLMEISHLMMGVAARVLSRAPKFLLKAE